MHAYIKSLDQIFKCINKLKAEIRLAFKEQNIFPLFSGKKFPPLMSIKNASIYFLDTQWFASISNIWKEEIFDTKKIQDTYLIFKF